MACKPYDAATDTGGYCFGSLLSQVLGVKFDECCMDCFAVNGDVVDNDSRPAARGT